MRRYCCNPIITPADVIPSREDFEVIGVFNAGAVEIEGRTLLLLRVAERPIGEGVVAPVFNSDTGLVELMQFSQDADVSDPRIIKDGGQYYITSISHLRRAWSSDGVVFSVEDVPALYPSNKYEEYGIEDPRITYIDEKYYVNYTGVSRYGAGTMLAISDNMLSFGKKGIIFAPDNRDVAIFPEKINGRYYALHRPSPGMLSKPSIWLASSENMLDWGHHECIMMPRSGFWDGEKVGGGAPPIRTAEGWLIIYHGVDSEDSYSLGAALLDHDDPSKVIGRSSKPILLPCEPYEVSGFYGKVTFTDGAILRVDGRLDIYYGAADETICLAQADINEILSIL